MTTVIRGEPALSEFRAKLTGELGLELLKADGQLLVQLPVGVGKSFWLDAITCKALGVYDLVVVLCPTRRLIEERAPLRLPPDGVKVINLRPRPAGRCGLARDAAWKKCEASDLGALGRAEICGVCQHRDSCYWPDQYGEKLEGARLIFATQAHLTRAPGFLSMLRVRSGAEKMLTLVDEANLVAAPAGSVITVRDLVQFREALGSMAVQNEPLEVSHRRWVYLMDALLGASTEDLQDAGWIFPSVRSDWALRVQRSGVKLYGDAFRFLGFRLHNLVFSPLETRRRNEAGDIEFSNRPLVGDCIVFSATTDKSFASYRLGKRLVDVFPDHHFAHPGTSWHNLASRIGTRRYFERHSAQVLDFFADLTARRAGEGKRVLLIAKKCFARLCKEGLDERFAALGADLHVETEDWSDRSLRDPRVVPFVSFGMIGTNLFESFDAAYCLTSFYVSESIVHRCVQDLTRTDLRLPIRIETCGSPRRRRAAMADPDHEYYDIARLVEPARQFKEDSVVVQAVGRVRPFTRPREVMTFQMSQLPGVEYTREFGTLSEMRRYFSIPSARERNKITLAAKIGKHRQEGKTQIETAMILGISERTVRNYERRTGKTP